MNNVIDQCLVDMDLEGVEIYKVEVLDGEVKKYLVFKGGSGGVKSPTDWIIHPKLYINNKVIKEVNVTSKRGVMKKLLEDNIGKRVEEIYDKIGE